VVYAGLYDGWPTYYSATIGGVTMSRLLGAGYYYSGRNYAEFDDIYSYWYDVEIFYLWRSAANEVIQCIPYPGYNSYCAFVAVAYSGTTSAEPFFEGTTWVLTDSQCYTYVRSCPCGGPTSLSASIAAGTAGRLVVQATVFGSYGYSLTIGSGQTEYWQYPSDPYRSSYACGIWGFEANYKDDGGAGTAMTATAASGHYWWGYGSIVTAIRPAAATVTFYTNPTTIGSITVSGVGTYTNGQSASLGYTSYTVTANPPSGYVSSWSFGGSVSTTGPNRMLVSGVGSLTANFIQISQPQPKLLVMSTNAISGTTSSPLRWSVAVYFSASALPALPSNPLQPSAGSIIQVGSWNTSWNSTGGYYGYLYTDDSAWGSTHYMGMITQQYPSSLSYLVNPVPYPIPCESAHMWGTVAATMAYVTGTVTITIVTDDAMEVWYAPVSSSGIGTWNSVFAGAAWKGQGATQYGPTTLSLSTGTYLFVTQWVDWCGGGGQGFKITGPVAAPTSLLGSVTPTLGASWQTVSSVSISASPNSGYVFGSWVGSGSGSYSGTTSSTSITMSATITEQANFGYSMTVSYQVSGGGTPTAPTFNYVQGGQSKQYTATGAPVPVVCDVNSAWSITNPLSNSGTEKWWSSQAVSGTATAATTLAFVYYHQYRLMLSYAVSQGGTPTAPTFTANRNGVSTPQVLTTTSTGYWYDNNAAWAVTPNPLIGSMLGERWYSNQTLSGSISSAQTFTFTFYHQILIIITSDPTGPGFVEVDHRPITTPMSYNWTINDVHNLKALSPVSCGNGCQYIFKSWSDGGAQIHDYRVSSLAPIIASGFSSDAPQPDDPTTISINNTSITPINTRPDGMTTTATCNALTITAPINTQPDGRTLTTTTLTTSDHSITQGQAASWPIITSCVLCIMLLIFFAIYVHQRRSKKG
jgi:hypothetical protein